MIIPALFLLRIGFLAVFCRRRAEAGDLEPEALRFISAAESPSGEALLVMTHEKSDSVTLLQLTPTTGGDKVDAPVS